MINYLFCFCKNGKFSIFMLKVLLMCFLTIYTISCTQMLLFVFINNKQQDLHSSINIDINSSKSSYLCATKWPTVLYLYRTDCWEYYMCTNTHTGVKLLLLYISISSFKHKNTIHISQGYFNSHVSIDFILNLWILHNLYPHNCLLYFF